jgi:two-component system, LytTR family, sensor kinase
MRKSFPLVLALFGIWTALALLSVLQTALFVAHRGNPIAWDQLVPSRLLDWYSCALFTPAFFWLARRYPIDRAHWTRALPVHLGASIASVILKYALLVAILRTLLGQSSVSLLGALSSNFFIELMIFWAVIGIVHAILFYRRSQEREQLATELRARLSEAQLEVLKGQLRPHFLFNTLNSVSTLVHSDPDAADRMVVQLGDLLRASLEHSGAHEIPLAEELALLERYLGIMRVRFHDRLRVELAIAPEAYSALVPHFILQPLVENALEHGIARRAGAGLLLIAARPDGRSLQLTVGDDGPGIDASSCSATGGVPGEGVGLGNTRLRLRQLYGDAHGLTIGQMPSGGTLVTMVLPLHYAAVGSAASPAAVRGAALTAAT